MTGNLCAVEICLQDWVVQWEEVICAAHVVVVAFVPTFGR